MRRAGPGVLGIALLILFAGCQRSEVNSAATRPTSSAPTDLVRVPSVVPDEQNQPCPRLLSAGPNVTEVCCALGLADCLVGRTRYCTYPPSIVSVTSIGALNDLNVEVLLALRPELVLVSGPSRAISERLARLELRYETLPDESLSDLFTSIRLVGALTDRPQTAARLVDAVKARLTEVTERYARFPPARVLLTLAPLADPPMQVFAAGPGSFYDDLLQRARQQNILPGTDRPFAPVSLEFILTADPDVIIELSPDGAGRAGGDETARQAWAQVGRLQAVAAQRVHVLAGSQHFVLGPRIAETMDALCALIAGAEP